MDDVVITGAGVISSIGCGRPDFWQGLRGGESGIAPLTLFGDDGLRCRSAAMVRFVAADLLGAKGLRYLSRSAHWLQCATLQALDDAGLSAETSRDDWALVVGTAFGSLQSISAFDQEALRHGPGAVNPMSFPNTVVNAPAGQTAIRFGLTGPNITISAGCASGLVALSHAVGLIRAGLADCVLAGGTEELCEASFRGHDRAGLLSPTAGAQGVQPFGRSRDGFVLGEGAAILVLESAERARRRSATVLGTIAGTGDAFGPGGGATAIRLALDDAATDAAGIDAVFSGAAGSLQGDAAEAEALRDVFGAEPAFAGHAVKAATGEALGASGALQAVAAMAALAAGCVPPTLNAGAIDPACAPPGVFQAVATMRPLSRALVTASTPEGQHSALVVMAPPAPEGR